MNKAELLLALDESRENFLNAIEGLSDEDLETPGVIGDWSIKDILAHLTMWEAELVRLLWQASQGRKPNTEHFSNDLDVDEINAKWYKQSQSRPLQRILDDFHGVRTQTIRRVEAYSDQDLNNPQRYPWLDGAPLWEWIAGDSFEHEAEHEVHIRSWCEKRGLK